MKLTENDKLYLLSIGYLNEDFADIETSVKYIRCTMTFANVDCSPIKVSHKQAMAILGRETYLSGIGRATFHSSAIRNSDSIHNAEIYFSNKD